MQLHLNLQKVGLPYSTPHLLFVVLYLYIDVHRNIFIIYNHQDLNLIDKCKAVTAIPSLS